MERVGEIGYLLFLATPPHSKMKIDVFLLLEATVICILAVCVVAPSADGQGGPPGSVGSFAERPTGDAGARSANNAEPAAVPPTGPSTKPINTTVTPAVSPSPRPFTKGSQDNCTAVNGTDCNTDQSLTARLLNNKGMLQRAIYVLVGVTVVILVYFGLRTWR